MNASDDNFSKESGKPCLSIVMSVYNCEKTVEKAVLSIIDQSFKDWELVVIDDGSEDSSLQILERLASLDERVFIISNEKNIGLPKSLNKGISKSQGFYLARMDADDVSLRTRLQKQIEFLVNNPDIDVVGTGAYLEDEHGAIIKEVCLPEKHDDLKKQPLLKTIFFHPSVMIRKSFFDRYGLYQPKLLRSQDKELWHRGMSQGAKYYNIQEPLIIYSTGGYIKSWKNIAYSLRSLYYIVRVHSPRLGYYWLLYSAVRSLSIKLRLTRPRSLM